jgi:DNA-binding MarR family transcriptional regulator/N-acetylglutamate synthase-like GNAT family acetyltransferase
MPDAAVITPVPDADVAGIRAFNRFYTKVIGVLGERLSHTEFSLTDARVLFELAQTDPRPRPVADVRTALDLDAGYLSRIVNRFTAAGLVERERSADDGRRVTLRLTAAGRDAFASLDRAAADEVRRLVAPLGDGGRRRLLRSMGAIEAALGAGGEADGAGEASPRRPGAGRNVVLRAPAPGDLGWILQRHGEVYAAEQGWNGEFEQMCAGILAGLVDGEHADRTAVWIAEVDGERAGSIACGRDDDDTARLRLLLVEPWARGLGVGGRLVDTCLAFARGAGYRRIALFTMAVLADARRIYERVGFTLDEEEKAPHFGLELVHQEWSRDL